MADLLRAEYMLGFGTDPIPTPSEVIFACRHRVKRVSVEDLSHEIRIADGLVFGAVLRRRGALRRTADSQGARARVRRARDRDQAPCGLAARSPQAGPRAAQGCRGRPGDRSLR